MEIANIFLLPSFPVKDCLERKRTCSFNATARKENRAFCKATETDTVKFKDKSFGGPLGLSWMPLVSSNGRVSCAASS